MNQEYRKQVFINDIGAYTILMWCNMVSWGTSIWDLEDRTPILFRQLHPKEGVYNFTTSKHIYTGWKIPQNYYYSSGLNNPNGYK
jgi:hypothetical protein